MIAKTSLSTYSSSWAAPSKEDGNLLIILKISRGKALEVSYLPKELCSCQVRNQSPVISPHKREKKKKKIMKKCTDVAKLQNSIEEFYWYILKK